MESAKVNENPLDCPPESDESRARVAEFYAPHNELFQELVECEMAWT